MHGRKYFYMITGKHVDGRFYETIYATDKPGVTEAMLEEARHYQSNGETVLTGVYSLGYMTRGQFFAGSDRARDKRLEPAKPSNSEPHYSILIEDMPPLHNVRKSDVLAFVGQLAAATLHTTKIEGVSIHGPHLKDIRTALDFWL